MKTNFRLQGMETVIEAVAQNEREEKALNKFLILAYTGAKMNVGWGMDVVIDIQGIEPALACIPVLKDHDAEKVIGHSTSISKSVEMGVVIEGVVSGCNEYANEVVGSSKNGFPWQASIGATPVDVEEIKESQAVVVNGESVQGPFYLVKTCKMYEVSFVSLGADQNTSAAIAAKLQLEENAMLFNEWVVALGFDVATLTEAQSKSLQELYEKQTKEVSDAEKPEQVEGEVAAVVEEVKEVAVVEVGDKEKKEAELEAARVKSIQSISAGLHPEMVDEAIKSKISPEEFSKKMVEAVRSERPAGFNIVSRSVSMDQQKVLEASLSLRAGVREERVIKLYGEQVMEAAQKSRNLGMRDVIRECIRLEGKQGSIGFSDATIKAGFSTTVLPNLLNTTIERALLEDFSVRNQESSVDKIFAVQDVSDFRSTGRLRGTVGSMEEVSNGAEIPALNVGEENYTGAAKTVAGRIVLTRQDIMNDDMGFLSNLPRILSKKAFDMREKQGIALIEANANNFFHATHSNLSTGALNLANLAIAVSKLRKQKDAAGDPINLQPRYILVPTELEATALALYSSTMIHGSSDGASDNYFKGRLIPVVSANLVSATAFYLIADPMDCAIGAVRYVNAVRTPQVEQSAMDVNTLSTSWTCYFDYGVALEDYRGGVKSTGV